MYQNLWPDELKILVVDDEQDMLNLIRLSLEPAGFRILRTINPREGLDMVLLEQPDLLLLDVMMPGIDGFEFLRRVRRHPDIGQIPAIIISAQANWVAKQRMTELFAEQENGVDAYVSKPFEPGQLLKTVKDVLLNHRDYLLEKQKLSEKARQRRLILESP